MAIQLTTRLKLFAAAAVVSGVCVGQAAPRTCDINAVDTVNKMPVVVQRGVTKEQFPRKKALLKRKKVRSLYEAKYKRIGKDRYKGDLYGIYLINRKNKGVIRIYRNQSFPVFKAKVIYSAKLNRPLWQSIRFVCDQEREGIITY